MNPQGHPARCGSRDLRVPGQQPQGRCSVGRSEGVAPDSERHPEITVPPHTPDGGLLPTPTGAPGTSAPVAPLVACSCVCSTSGLLVKTQAGCSTVPFWVWVWKILLFPLPGSLFQEALPDTEPRVASSLGQGRGRGWISWLFRSPGLLHPLGAFSVSRSVMSDSL